MRTSFTSITSIIESLADSNSGLRNRRHNVPSLSTPCVTGFLGAVVFGLLLNFAMTYRMYFLLHVYIFVVDNEGMLNFIAHGVAWTLSKLP